VGRAKGNATGRKSLRRERARNRDEKGRKTSETNDGTAPRFAVKRSGAGENTDAEGDNAGFDCLPFTRPGEGDYTCECNTSMLRAGK